MTTRKFEYIKSTKKENKALQHASTLLKQPMMYANIHDDYQLIQKGCTYLPNFFCATQDRTLFNQLLKELDMNQMMSWSRHQKYENPEYSPTFCDIVQKMANHFNVKVMETRLNYYKDYTTFKPMHKDSHHGEENFTMGASFGFTRALDFVHDKTKQKFTFPQHNGDIFAFDDKINTLFMHGVPKINTTIQVNTERISIIAWGVKI